MSTIIITPNMGLVVPIVGQESGAQYATDVNSSLTIVDQHDHTPGHGVLITPAALNINSQLNFNIQDAINLNSVRFSPLASPINAVSPNLDCIYVSGVDLYYNDGSGNQIQITTNGGVAGSPGSISGLTSPASASYNSGTSTFTWQSAASTPANMDFASAILRNLTANSKGLTLAPPNSMASDYSIVLPSLPLATSYLFIDSAGNMSTTLTAALADNIATAMDATGANTVASKRTRTVGSTVGTGGVAFSTSSGTQIITGGGPITGLSVTITTSGRPVMVGFTADNAGPGTQNFLNVSSRSGAWQINNGSNELGRYIQNSGTTIPSSSVNFLDTTISGSPGTYTYSAFVSVGSNGTIQSTCLYAYEL